MGSKMKHDTQRNAVSDVDAEESAVGLTALRGVSALESGGAPCFRSCARFVTPASPARTGKNRSTDARVKGIFRFRNEA